MSASGFADHFSGQAPAYARYRPVYPAALSTFLAETTPGRAQAWDCGTGSGQAAVMLAADFERVLATDPSAEQLAHARSHPRITYRVGREAESGLRDRSADLVAAAQAAHWFDLPAFYREAGRVLRPGGVVAVWCYGLMTIEPALDAVLRRFYHERLERHWPPERRFVDAGYEALPFPYARLPVPPMAIEAALDLEGLLGYLGTWSAVARCRQEEGGDPLADLAAEIGPLWPAAPRSRPVRWPLSVLVGRADGTGGPPTVFFGKR